MADDTFSARTRVVRKPERAHYDRESIHAILDAARICHVGLVRDGLPVVLPTIHARDGDTVLLHGSTGAGFVRDAKRGTPLCISVTIIDGLVLSRAARNHSMNYRSAVIFGEGTLVRDDGEKLCALEIITDADADLDVTAWAGVVPIITGYGDPEPAPFSPAGAIAPTW